MEVLDNGQVDFMLEVRNDQTLDDEIAQLQMSVDGGAPELVNIIANLPAGESVSFAFARTLAPGPHTIRFSVGDSHTKVSVNVEGDSVIVSTPTPRPTVTVTSTTIPTPIPNDTAVPANTPTPSPSVRTIYAIPSDRIFEERFATVIQDAVIHVQDWYAAQLDGYTFAVVVPIPEVCSLNAPADYYEGVGGWNRVIEDLQNCAPVKHFSPDHVWAIYIDADLDCDGGGELGAGGDGVTIVHRGDLEGLVDPTNYRLCDSAPRSQYGWIGGLAHELGHAFGLPHPPGCNDGLSHCDEDALMWHGYYWDYPETYLTADDMNTLRASPFFRSSLPTATPIPTVTPEPKNTPPPTRTPLPTNTPAPTHTPTPTTTPLPTNTAVPTNTPESENSLSRFFKSTKELTEINDSSQPDIDVGVLEILVHNLINQERVKRGLEALYWDEEIAAIARNHSVDMGAENYFSHVNQAGQDPTDRGASVGYDCIKDYGSYYTFGLAENIHQGWLYSSITTVNGVDFYNWLSQDDIAARAVNGWMGSQGHRENILKDTYDRTGIGIGVTSEGKVFITQNFC